MWALSESSECEQFSQIPLQSTRVGQNPSASCQSVSSWNPPMNLSHKYLAFLGCLPQWRTHPRLFKTAFLSPSKLCSLGWQFSKDRKTPSMRVTRYPRCQRCPCGHIQLCLVGWRSLHSLTPPPTSRGEVLHFVILSPPFR